MYTQLKKNKLVSTPKNTEATGTTPDNFFEVLMPAFVYLCHLVPTSISNRNNEPALPRCIAYFNLNIVSGITFPI